MEENWCCEKTLFICRLANKEFQKLFISDKGADLIKEKSAPFQVVL